MKKLINPAAVAQSHEESCRKNTNTIPQALRELVTQETARIKIAHHKTFMAYTHSHTTDKHHRIDPLSDAQHVTQTERCLSTRKECHVPRRTQKLRNTPAKISAVQLGQNVPCLSSSRKGAESSGCSLAWLLAVW